jgi:hypothetical protein
MNTHAITDGEAFDLIGKSGGKRVVDTTLNIDAISTDAGLAGGAELGGDGACDSAVEIGVVEHDKGGVAAELERELLEGVGGLAHEQLADARGAGEGDLADGRVCGERLADLGGVRVGCDDIDEAGGEAGAVGEFGEGEGGEGGFGGGLGYNCAAGGEGRADFAVESQRRRGKLYG